MSDKTKLFLQELGDLLGRHGAAIYYVKDRGGLLAVVGDEEVHLGWARNGIEPPPRSGQKPKAEGLKTGARFDGADYVPERDDKRLEGQIKRVWEAIKDGRRFTLQQLSETTGDPEASVSAQLRHLRKPKFGSKDIRKEYKGHGLYEYWLSLEDEG